MVQEKYDIIAHLLFSFLSITEIHRLSFIVLPSLSKSTLLKIMAGIEKEYDGIARPLPGASIGYLSQEPTLEFETVQECIDAAVSSSRAILDKYNELSLSMANPDISDEEMTSVMNQMESIGDKIEAENLWDLDRTVERAMDALRVPPGDAKTAVLSGGEKRRVSLCQLLLGSHDMLLLDEVCYRIIDIHFQRYIYVLLCLSHADFHPVPPPKHHSQRTTLTPKVYLGLNSSLTNSKALWCALHMTDIFWRM